MAATTTLLGLVTPTQGTITGTWGDTVNYGISDYLDIAIAGTLSFAGDGAITLANTTGSSSGNSIGATTAQYAIIKVTGTLTTAKIITGPSYSKTYLVVNAATGSTVTFKASGQTGVSIAVGETALVYYNGTDYVKLVGTATAGAAGGSNTQVQYNNSGVLAGITGATTNGTALTLVAPVLGTPASGTVTNLTGTASININGTVGATTANTGAFTTLSATKPTTIGDVITFTSGAAGSKTGYLYVNTNYVALAGAAGGGSGMCNIALSATGLTLYGPDQTKTAVLDNTGLAVTGTLSATGTLSGGTSGTAYSFSGSAPATSLTLNSSGYLGIGATSPDTKIDIKGSETALLSNQTSTYAPSANAAATSVKLLNDSSTTGAYASLEFWTRNAVSNINIAYIASPSTSSNDTGTLVFGRRTGNVSSAESMRLDSSGNLGIGTSSPSQKLTVNGVVASIGPATALTASSTFLDYNTTSNLGRFAAVGNTTGTAAPIYFSQYSSNASVGRDAVIIDSGGNLGLGVTPSAWGSSFKVLQLANGTSLSNNGQTSYYQLGANNYFDGTNYLYIASNFAGFHRFSNAGAYEWHNAASGTAGNAISFTQAMTLDASGNLGIGTTSPAYRLDVAGEISQSKTSNTTVASGGFDASTSWGLKIANASTTAGTGAGIYFLGGTNSESYIGNLYDSSGVGALSFQTRVAGVRAERMRIDSSGNLLVGTTSVPTTTRTTGFAAKPNSTGGISIYQVTNVSDWGINATSGSIVNFYSDTGSALTYAGTISVNGIVTTYGSVSDYRLKENIVPMTSALSKVQALNPVTFTFKDSGQTSQGFIAHELQVVVPDAVIGEKDAVDKDGKPQYQSVDTSFLVATLTAAIQEQQALITQLTARITALETA